MNRKEALRQARQVETLQSLGFTSDEAESLRRISMTLQRWFELECGDAAGWCVERDGDEDDSTPYMRKYDDPSGKDRRYKVADRETGARKRLAKILEARNTRAPGAGNATYLDAYIQTDPRGAALYILRPGDVPEGADVSSYYSRGICVY